MKYNWKFEKEKKGSSQRSTFCQKTLEISRIDLIKYNRTCLEGSVLLIFTFILPFQLHLRTDSFVLVTPIENKAPNNPNSICTPFLAMMLRRRIHIKPMDMSSENPVAQPLIPPYAYLKEHVQLRCLFVLKFMLKRLPAIQ